MKHKRKASLATKATAKKLPSERQIRRSYWGYSEDVYIYPDSVIVADETKQNYSVMPRPYYVDILKSCRDCQNEFIFYATEQRHWYETLGFYIDADCVRCPNCRTTDQTLRRRFTRYSKNITRKDLTDEEFTMLLGDALFLYESGLLKTDQQLRRLRNQARKRLPDSKILTKLDAALTKNRTKPKA
ncbi:MAG: zinc-ribbon domain containing protein [Verrucomicrobiota bacterium]